MVSNDVNIPTLPHDAVTETNRETLARLREDLAWIDDRRMVAGDEYRMYVNNDVDPPFWGYCVETAQVENPRDMVVLMHSTDGRTHARRMQWLPMGRVYRATRTYTERISFEVCEEIQACQSCRSIGALL